MTIKAATLAVGTELTDGQITDRNSAWISQRLVKTGIQVVEHRAVADDHADIERALVELTKRVNLLFVTGGLGPTSDDFTRDVLAKCFGRPLEFHEPSWKQIQEKLGARGVVVREIQKQQCYYPRGSTVLDNPAGTANGFAFETDDRVKVLALPGPPAEIAAVWEKGLESDLEALVPADQREKLVIYRCLGRPESEVAEATEAAIAGSGLRVGYRAHLPYVEVKLWHRGQSEETLRKVERALGDWVINRNGDDVADPVIDRVKSQQPLHVLDSATQGALQARLLDRARERKIEAADLQLTVTTFFSSSLAPSAMNTDVFKLEPGDGAWLLRWQPLGKPESVLEIKAPFNYKLGSERARRYVVEKALHELGSLL